MYFIYSIDDDDNDIHVSGALGEVVGRMRIWQRRHYQPEWSDHMWTRQATAIALQCVQAEYSWLRLVRPAASAM